MTFTNNFVWRHKSCRSKRAMHALLFLTVVALAVSSTGCAKKVAVPDVTQQDLDQAGKTLAGMQLKRGTGSGNPSGSTPGAYVLTQKPPAGQPATRDSAVDFCRGAPTL